MQRQQRFTKKMSQQTKQATLGLNVDTTPKKKISRVRFADTQAAINNDTPTSKPKQATNTTKSFHINILLENSSYSIIGFVIIKDKNDDFLTLFNVRQCIKSQFDQDQLQVLGGGETFKFLRNSIPISKKQEELINIAEINISDPNSIKFIQQASFRKPKSKTSLGLVFQFKKIYPCTLFPINIKLFTQ